jgi:hypothetical protein
MRSELSGGVNKCAPESYIWSKRVKRSEHTVVVFEQEGKGSSSGVQECTTHSMDTPHSVDAQCSWKEPEGTAG